MSDYDKQTTLQFGILMAVMLIALLGFFGAKAYERATDAAFASECIAAGMQVIAGDCVAQS